MDENLQAFDLVAEAKGFKQLMGSMTKFASSAVISDVTDVVGEKTAVQILAENIEGLKMNVTTTLQKFQLQCTSLKVIKTRAEASKEVDMLVAFVKTLNAVITKNQSFV